MIVVPVLIIVLSVAWLVIQYIRKRYFTVLVGIDDSRSTNVMKCAHCSVPITKENDSGWEAFVANGYTQRLCTECDQRLTNEPIQKSE